MSQWVDPCATNNPNIFSHCNIFEKNLYMHYAVLHSSFSSTGLIVCIVVYTKYMFVVVIVNI